MENLKNREIIKHFYKFLKIYKIREKFIYNFCNKHYSRKKLTYEDIIVFIVTRIQNNDYDGLFKRAFPWCQTYEGTTYWSIVYNAWIRYLKKNHLLNDNFF